MADPSPRRWVDAPELPDPGRWSATADAAVQSQRPAPVRAPRREARTSGNRRHVVRALVLLVAGCSLALVATMARGLGGADSRVPIDRDVLVVYEAEEGVVGDAVYTHDEDPRAEDRVGHDALWQEWRELVPPYWARRVELFTVSSDGVGGTAAYVQRRDLAGDRWLLAVDPVDAAERPAVYAETLVHELAHIVTLGAGRLEVEGTPTTLLERHAQCPGRAVEDGCAAPDSVLAAFTARFWDEEALAAADGLTSAEDWEAATVALYRQDPDRWVTPYAATSPAEDVAETFAVLALDLPVVPNSESAEKVAMLAADPELFALADRVRAVYARR